MGFPEIGYHKKHKSNGLSPGLLGAGCAFCPVEEGCRVPSLRLLGIAQDALSCCMMSGHVFLVTLPSLPAKPLEKFNDILGFTWSY